MRRTKIVALIVAAVMVSFAVPISAHHSFAAEFDAAKPVTLKGTVTKIERVNPHGWIYLDVKTPNGNVEHWAIETGVPSVLARQGIKKDSMPVGAEVIVKGYRAKDGSLTANGQSITLPDGRDFSLAPSYGNSGGKSADDK